MTDEPPIPNEESGGATAEEAVAQEPIRYAAPPPETGSLLRSFTRLLVGGTLVAWDQLTTQLRSWEEETQSIQASEWEGEGIIAYRSEQTTSPEQAIRPPAAPGDTERGSAETADVLLGMLFELPK